MIVGAKKLSIGYPEKVVCENINFEIESGDFLCVVGENGTGKSTLIKTILGLNKTLKGTISFHEGHSKCRVGYLPQIGDMQKDFPATVKEVIMSGFMGTKFFKFFFTKEEKAKAIKMMELTGVSELQNKSFKELSGGQQQRVLLTRALLATDDLLILDEPTNGLDAKFTRSFYSLLKTLNKSGITIIMVSHNIGKVTEMASHILCLKKSGNFFGTKDEFLSSDLASQMLGLEGGER